MVAHYSERKSEKGRSDGICVRRVWHVGHWIGRGTKTCDVLDVTDMNVVNTCFLMGTTSVAGI